MMNSDRNHADTVKRMTDAALALLQSLDDGQRKQVCLPFDSDVRTDWHYVPRGRPGLPLKQMDAIQQQLTRMLVSTGLSATGHHTAMTIMELETVLAGIEGGGRRFPRDPELYFVSVFGDVGSDQPWGWRFEGHHISINHTIFDGRQLATAPVFFGSNPAQVRHGERQGLRALAAEEDVARDLLAQLDGDQRSEAIICAEAPTDILTTNVVSVTDEVRIEGLVGQDMTAAQRQTLEALIHVYISRMPEAVAEAEMGRVRNTDLTKSCFVWAGSTAPGKGHYYRVQGDCFVAEYDNTQNDANHIHAVWRDLQDDFGQQMLRDHYRTSH
ncbi:MAG: DUF3500 domain-containing protein [Candidatus Latescibacteria bacterium]|jgi:hypothetical protein|nr:DUF3500 domain-containing protein [Candidatus Latescibacterota bacterium]